MSFELDHVRELKKLRRTKSGLRQGEVTAVSPLEVSIAGGSPVLAQALDGVELQVGDRVSIEVQGHDFVVLGRNTDDPQGGGGPPTGTAGGDLSGTYPNPEIAAGVVGGSEIASSLKPSGSATGTTESLRRLGTGSTHAAAGDDSRFPSAGEKNALAGTQGTPGSGNRYVTDQDSRLSDDRDPNAHATSHKDGGSDELKLHELGEPTGNVDFNGWELEHVASGTQADSGVNLSQLDLVRMGFSVRPQADFATVQALDAYTGSGTGTLEASSNGDLLDALGLEAEHWDYSLTFLAAGTPYAIATDGTYFYVTIQVAGVNGVWKFNSSGQSVNSFTGGVPFFGGNGSGNGQFGGPCYGICVDSSGNIYVADTFNNRIQKFNSSGTYQAQVGSFGTGNGQFRGLGGLACDSSNFIYARDGGLAARVQKFNSSLAYQSQFGTPGTGNGQFDRPIGVAVDGSNNVWVADFGNSRVQKFNSSGTYQSQFAVPESPYFIAVDSSTNVYVTDSDSQVQKFNSSGIFLAKVGSYGPAHGQLKNPQGLAVDTSGDLYLADRGNNRVEKFTYSASPSVATGQSVIVKDQAYGGPHVDHGVYDITATGGVSSKWELTRREDMDNGSEIMSGLLVNAKQRGPNIPGGMWYVSTPDPITIDTTPITFEQFQPGGPPTPHGFQHVHDGSDPIPVEDWIEVGVGSAPAFENSWTNFGVGYAPARFYKDPFGIVHLGGMVKSGTINQVAFTLPAGYRPNFVAGPFPAASNAAFAYVEIATTGGVFLRPGSSSWFSLEGISFRAEA